MKIQTENYTLYHADCFDVFSEIPDKSVDAIICDLPYGTTACKWDTILPLDKLWEQYKRIIKPNGAIVLFGSQPFTTRLISSNYEMFKCEWIWKKQKPTNFYQCKNQPLKEHENILIFGVNKTKYYPQDTKKVNILSGRKNKSSNLYSKYDGKDYVQTVGNYPRSIVFFPTEGDKYRKHPTQKPVALMEYLIKTYTNEGETVLDNCMGSGTTGVACIKQNRIFIGMEKEEKYFEISKNRIEKELQDQKSKLF